MTGKVMPASPGLFLCSFGTVPVFPLQQSVLVTLILWIDCYGPGDGESGSVGAGALGERCCDRQDWEYLPWTKLGPAGICCSSLGWS